MRSTKIVVLKNRSLKRPNCVGDCQAVALLAKSPGRLKATKQTSNNRLFPETIPKESSVNDDTDIVADDGKLDDRIFVNGLIFPFVPNILHCRRDIDEWSPKEESDSIKNPEDSDETVSPQLVSESSDPTSVEM
ncbi:hypothetical protein BLNAU_22730 [Blattamonas nauphoetae]|uniref:Uncharacterized protein n=1 Tax=Blattamonas nauphoetae TaxID=2049346 RepID=A0ABQ9WSN6_9EUKA|nr:hypothetical protein BLNAU_22730 [Blattamonas nauphoetae]